MLLKGTWNINKFHDILNRILLSAILLNGAVASSLIYIEINPTKINVC